jgi:hypothetical protein
MTERAILDRPLELSWLDVALRLTQAAEDVDHQRELLDIALRDSIPGRWARAKTRTALARIWLDPPEAARPLIGWATNQATNVADTRILHMGAMLASYPFFGDVCSIIGRELALHEEVRTPHIRRRVRSLWGDRTTVDAAARRVVRTLRALGILTGDLGSSSSTLGEQLHVSMPFSLWVVHALLVARDAQETDEREVHAAPELFMFDLHLQNGSQDYPYLERFNEGGGRTVLSLRAGASRSSPPGPASPSQLSLDGIPEAQV